MFKSNQLLISNRVRSIHSPFYLSMKLSIHPSTVIELIFLSSFHLCSFALIILEKHEKTEFTCIIRCDNENSKCNRICVRLKTKTHSTHSLHCIDFFGEFDFYFSFYFYLMDFCVVFVSFISFPLFILHKFMIRFETASENMQIDWITYLQVLQLKRS